MNNQMLSLYDYLGKPAGGELGAEVAKSATTKNIPYSTKYVETLKYKGKIMMYPVYFLDEYFKRSSPTRAIVSSKVEDDLPF
jgi:hypothetical protein